MTVVSNRCRRCGIPLVASSLEAFGDVVAAHEKNQHAQRPPPPVRSDPPHADRFRMTETEHVRPVPDKEQPWAYIALPSRPSA